MTEALNRAPTGDSARGPGVDETPGPHPLTRRRPESSTSAHATPQAGSFRFPRFSKSVDTQETAGRARADSAEVRHAFHALRKVIARDVTIRYDSGRSISPMPGSTRVRWLGMFSPLYLGRARVQ